MLKEAPMDTRSGEAATFTSIGKLGVSRRSHDRLYANGTRFSPDPVEFDRNFRRLVEIGKRNEKRVGRSVFRGLVSGDVVSHVLSSDLRDNLEVALPVGEFTGDNSWLVYMAQNKSGRDPIDSRETMIRETTRPAWKEITPPIEKVKSVVDKGFAFTDRIAEDQIDQVLSLWGNTFGWTREDVVRKRLDLNKQKPSSQKDVWFSAATKDGKIVGLAMAERLPIPGQNGRVLDLVESTEWRADDGHANNGLMIGTLNMLKAQVLFDLKDSPNGTPLIFAECNFQSHSEWVGQASGLRIPDRTSAPQILTQNVLVRDSHPVGDSKLRDFSFLYLPKDVIRRHYSPAQVAEMKAMAKV